MTSTPTTVNIRFLRNIVCWDDPEAALFTVRRGALAAGRVGQ